VQKQLPKITVADIFLSNTLVKYLRRSARGYLTEKNHTRLDEQPQKGHGDFCNPTPHKMKKKLLSPGKPRFFCLYRRPGLCQQAITSDAHF
jgi:hypothetical protein